MGARGNSGVILSQIVRGAAEKVATPPGRLIDPELIEAALTNAADRAYASVREPAEGTMLTVIRAMADAVAERRAQWQRERLDPDATEAEQNALLAEMLATALFAGEEAVRHTPEQLDVLAEAGVVDAGALGLVVIIRGMVAGLAGEQVQLPEIPHYAAARLDQVHHADSAYRYCTNFIVTGEGLDGDAFVGELEGLGDSVLVVGDEATLKVHVHTDDPDAATALFDGAGEISTTTSPTCTSRSPASERGSSPRASGVVAVASGEGMRTLFEALGALCVDGGPTLNPLDQGPARGDRGLRRRRGDRAAELAQRDHGRRGGGAAGGQSRPGGRRRRRRVPAGRARGAGRVRPRRRRGRERRAPRRRARGVRVGAVAPAARDDAEGRFRRGDSVGFAERRDRRLGRRRVDPGRDASPRSPTAPRSSP